MKIIKIIFFNILLAVFFLFVVEFIILNVTKDENEKKIFNIYIPTYGDYRYPVSYIEQPRFFYGYKGEDKKQPVMLIGCSYAYGHGLKYKKTFAAKLSNIMKRDIYNLSEIGSGPIDILISLDYSKHFYDIKIPPEYIIYVYMYHHPNRIPFNFSKTDYMQNNGILLKENHSIFKKLYLYKNLRKQKLESITIGLFSFSDFSKQFLIRNLTSLTTVTIGMYGSMSDREIFSPSYNFHCAELVIESKRSNLVSILDLPNLVSLTIGDGAFLLFPYARIESKSLGTTLLIDIPLLTEIKFGYMALQGNDDDMNCTLIMKGNISKKMVER